MSTLDSHCTVLLPRDTDPPSVQDLRARIEKGTDPERIVAMKRILTLLLQGERVSQLLMPIIQFVMPRVSGFLLPPTYFFGMRCPWHHHLFHLSH